MNDADFRLTCQMSGNTGFGEGPAGRSLLTGERDGLYFVCRQTWLMTDAYVFIVEVGRGSGKLPTAGLRKALQEMGLLLTNNMISKLIKLADEKNTGSVNYAGFLKAFAEAASSAPKVRLMNHGVLLWAAHTHLFILCRT